MDLLSRIKRLAAQRRVRLTEKAAIEMDADELTVDDVIEAILNATYVRSKRSTSPLRGRSGERVHILQGFTYDGILVYTKGVIRKILGEEYLFVLISAKRSTMGDQE